MFITNIIHVYIYNCGVTEGNSRVTGIAGLISILEQAVIAKGIKWPLYEHQRFFCNATKIIAI